MNNHEATVLGRDSVNLAMTRCIKLWVILLFDESLDITLSKLLSGVPFG